MRYLRSVYAKNFITIVLVFCLSLLILGAAFAGMSYSFILRQRADAMTDSAGTTGEMLRSYAQQWGTGVQRIFAGRKHTKNRRRGCRWEVSRLPLDKRRKCVVLPCPTAQ